MGDRTGRQRAGAAALVAALLSATVVTVAATPAAAATTLSVPSQYATISAALTAAVDGDTIQVAPGTYDENLTIDSPSKGVRLVSTGGPAVTTIDGNNAGPVIYLGEGSEVEGFTITGGSGHAISVANGTGTVIRGNRFVGNVGSGYYTSIILVEYANPTIDRNEFVQNSCDASVPGSDPGAVIVPIFGAPTITNNLFRDNACERAISLGAEAVASAVNNTIVGSDIGLWLGGSAPHVVRNNLITDNETGVQFGTNGAILDHNFVGGNGIQYTGVPDQTGTNGNVTGDPGLIDLAGRDLRLQSSSPAVDAGSPTDAPALDFDGTARPVDGPDADGDAEFDIGAHERDGTEPPPVPPTGVLDTGWSGDGVSLYPNRYEIALGPYGDGATFVGSYKATDGNGPMRVTKLTSTGAAAPGWGSAGYVLRAFEPGGKGISFPTQVVPVGLRITVVGEHYRDTARLGVARLRSDGSYDPAFSTDGRALYKVFPTEHDVVSAFRAEVLSGGKIGLAVVALDYNSRGELVFTAQAMLRLNSSGTLDRTFSGDGVAVVPTSWSDIRWMPNGASFVGVQGSVSHQVRKLLPSGQLDTSFSGDGIATAACGTHRGANMAIDPSNRPVLMCVKVSGTSTVLAMYRFTTSGGFDSSYSGDGKTTWVIPNSSTGFRAHFDQSAKPWAAAAGPGATTKLRLYTLNSSGAPDTTFSGDGTATVTLPWNTNLGGVWRSGHRLLVTNFVGTVNVGIVGVKI